MIGTAIPADDGVSSLYTRLYIVASERVTKTFINAAIFKRKDSEGDDDFLT